jgi:hypothetical protein
MGMPTNSLLNSILTLLSNVPLEFSFTDITDTTCFELKPQLN